jgi:hypothetical protein
MEETNVTKSRYRVLGGAVGVVTAASLLFTAFASADGGLRMMKPTKKSASQSSLAANQHDKSALLDNQSKRLSGSQYAQPGTRVKAAPTTGSRPLQRLDLNEIAEGFAWYNGRKLPILTPQFKPLPENFEQMLSGTEGLFKGNGENVPQTYRNGSKGFSQMNLSSRQPQIQGSGTPCPGSVGCQLPSIAGAGSGRDVVGFPATANASDANGDVVGANSDAAAGLVGTNSFAAADNFEADETGTVNQVCWWGFYGDLLDDPAGSGGAEIGADECSAATAASVADLGSATGTFNFNLVGATDSPENTPGCTFFSLDTFRADVWYRWTAPANGLVRLNTCQQPIDTKVGVYTGPVCPAAGSDATLEGCSDDGACTVGTNGLASNVDFNATSGQVYYIRIGLFPGTPLVAPGAGTFELNYLDPDCGPQTDDFTVTFYADDVDGTVPGTVIGQYVSGVDLNVSRIATGGSVALATGNVDQYEYTGTITSTGVSVVSGDCYWVEIQNNVTGKCDWYWQTSDTGDSRSQLNIDGAGYQPVTSSNQAFDNFDLAFCLDVAFTGNGCFEIVPDTVLFDQDAAQFFGTVDFVHGLDLDRTNTNPHGLTYIESFSGATGCDPGIVAGTDIFHLVEFWDDDLSGSAGASQPIHSGYLGGFLVNLGPYDGVGSDFANWFLTAPLGFFFLDTGDDDRIIVSERNGLVSGGVFIGEPAQDLNYTAGPLCSVAQPGPRLSCIFATGANLVVNAGALDPNVLYSDGFGSGSDTDRVSLGADGPLAFGGQDGMTTFELRGFSLADCDANGVPDTNQIACFNSGHTGVAGCPTGECPVFEVLGSNGFLQSTAFLDPLVQSGLGSVTCVPASEDVDSNGTPDECDSADCDGDGISDGCELSCSNLNFLETPTELCSQSVLDGDISTCGVEFDCNSNSIPDTCELAGNDCNNNNVPDECDIAPIGTLDDDCNDNGTPDQCELDSGAETDCNQNGTLDICEFAFLDCNRNGITDQCDILLGNSNDQDANNTPDECVDVCVLPFAGFENAPFTLGSGVDGLDALEPGNGDTWFNAGGGSQIQAQTCPNGPQAGPNGNSQVFTQSADSNGFTNSELFVSDSQGSSPVSSTFMEATFDWAVTGRRNSDNDIRLFLIDNAGATQDSVILMWFASDTSASVPNPGNLHVLDNGGFQDTGVDLNAGECGQAIVRFDNLNQSVELLIGTNGSTPVTVYGPTANNILTPGATRLDFFQVGGFNSGSIPQTIDTDAFLQLDNFEICESGAAVDCSIYKNPDGSPGTDCDGDQVCDLFQLNAFTDADNDGQLDICEGFCDDCNNNFTPDSAEIAAGTVLDVAPANGIPDVCEPASGYNYDFENFVVGDADGQQGWNTFEPLNAAAEIREDAVFNGDPNNAYLAVVSRADNETGNGFVLGPRQDSLGDAGVEIWSWKMRIQDPSVGVGGLSDFGRVFIEVLDLCEDEPTLINNINGIIGARNAGFQFTTLSTGEGAAPSNSQVNIYLLGKPGNVPQYEQAFPSLTPADVRSRVVNNTWAAALRIHNSNGLGTGYFAQIQGDIPIGPTSDDIGNATTGETTEQITDIAGNSRYRGGDRQLMIRTDGNYGAADDIAFLFDDFEYTAITDCDNDGIRDSVFLGFSPNHDRNLDGIPDRCQDCDNDCPSFPLAADNPCLDPAEAVGNDCNANGLQDDCDVDSTRPAQNIALNEFYDGGGSCDFNGDGTPDECEGGFTDCNGNGCNDASELASAGFGGTAVDIDNDGTLDECEADCNNNNVPDDRDLALGVGGGGSQDSDDGIGFTGDGFPDECCVDLATDTLLTPDGDMDRDGDRDEVDYQLIQRCAGQTPPNCPDSGCVNGVGTVRGSATGGFPPGWDGLQCGCADFNADGKVDECDLQIFQTLITGPN